MDIKIALAGNPNCGKTTLFNALTGSNQFVGNWPGVTVEKKEGRVKSHKNVTVMDLPGIYSLSPYSLEEVISRDYILGERPDVLVSLIDGTNLERNLYLTTQILELGIPVVAAVNFIDVVERSGDRIDLDALSRSLGCPVCAVSALKGSGLRELIEKVLARAAAGGTEKAAVAFSAGLEAAITEIEGKLDAIPAAQRRFFAVKLLERDVRVAATHGGQCAAATSAAEALIPKLEAALGDEVDARIAEERYNAVDRIVEAVLLKKKTAALSTSDKIDRVLTHRVFALPIFAVVIFLIYYVSISTVGTALTDWVNDGIFGDSWSFFGLEVPGIPAIIGGILEKANAAEWISSLVLDGIVAGVGAVLGFIPQMAVLFLFLAALEGFGYMARIAFILDRLFRRFGLSGKSFIPLLIGSGCGIPGIMASRTIEAEKDRRLTVMTTTFIPCSAKLPIIALISGAVFGGVWWVAPSTYFLGIAAVLISGTILKKMSLFKGAEEPFVMELPAYHLPSIGNVLRSVGERASSFVRRAGTVILLSAVVIWFLSSFGFTDGGFGMVEDLNEGLLSRIGSAIAFIFAPLGFGRWDAAVATITGLIAKENVVGTMGVLYGFAEVAEDGEEMWGTFAKEFSMLGAYAFLAFNLYCPPCFAAIGAVRREMNNAKWTLFAVGYQLLTGYALALLIYQFGLLFTGHGFTIGTAAALAALVGILYLVFRRPAADKALAGAGGGKLHGVS